MKIIIKNPAPYDKRKKYWGDYYFGRSLTKYLNRLGIDVRTHYKSEWGKREKVDAVIVLRGKYPYYPVSGAKNILWIYSHPASITDQELDNYDAVCVASEYHAALLQKSLNKPVITLLQCTDPEEFSISETNQKREGVVFVGNTRNVPRPCVQWAVEYGLDLRIWGSGWEEFIDEKYVMGDYINNEELGGLYKRSLFTINDHWNDMSGFGYINNRIFDALACGLPVISDYHESLHNKFPDEILYYKNKDDFFRCIDSMLKNYESISKMTYGTSGIIKNDFSFETRACRIIDLINSIDKKYSSTHEVPVRFLKRISRRNQTSKESLAKNKLLKKIFMRKEKNRFCPVCFSFIDYFINEVDEQNETVKCPNCSSMERHRVFWVHFSNHIASLLKKQKLSVLHMFPEKPIIQKLETLENIIYTSADPSSRMAMVKIDRGTTYFPDEKFDLIICSRLTGSITERTVLFKETYRILRNNGMAVFQLPPAEMGISDSYEEDIIFEVEKAGFSVKPVRLGDEIKQELAFFLGLNEHVFLECNKQYSL